jgi:hypothetical protein
MICKVVLGLQASHLLLKCTTSGNGTVLTAACVVRAVVPLIIIITIIIIAIIIISIIYWSRLL